MDLSGFVVILGSVLAGAGAGFIGGSTLGWLSNWALSARLNSCEQSIKQLNNKLVSPNGVAARQEKSERMSEAMATAMIAMKEEGAVPAEVLKKVAAAYPDVALEVVKKIGKGRNPLGGLI